ncbi:ABC transporter transmembrane domain-containing protein [Psychromicrobium lacuslunae]|uniref:Multidrug ABC transporter permease n=1 Tax=Psychromicrobium lacuslunae TaxID=1618207 RepID=A0A0D4BZW8_9MICC|nr:ABC transporter ATP-binding protein [Psychromicrobium lacuslunae]AJT41636.1 multidrug ABC transporter permease [Psychromicrobium lacuslunae]
MAKPTEVRSPSRYLIWLGLQQLPSLAAGVLFGSLWLLAQALMPLLLGWAIDFGVNAQNWSLLLLSAIGMVFLGAVQAIFAVLRHRIAVSNWLQASFRSVQLIGHKISRTGAALPKAISTGELVNTAASDATRIGQIYDLTARLSGAVLSYALVSILIWQISWGLGVTVLLGVPVCCALLLFIIRPLQARQREQREMAGKMTAVGADTVAGLRVLRGIGGEHIFVSRYRERSQQTRFSGNKVARSVANLEGTQLLVTGGFSVLFTWLGAAMALRGEISTGQLISLYGFSVFLVTPVRILSETVSAAIRGYVGARKTIAVLSTPPAYQDAGQTPAPRQPAVLRDTASGAVIQPGRLTAVVSSVPASSAELAERLGRFDDALLEANPVFWGDLDTRTIGIPDLRSRIVLSEADPQLFSGPLRELLDPEARNSDQRILQILEDASSLDILDGLEEGLDHHVTERGRGFSGGQRQRLALCRALLSDAETLLLVEPTSAVDAHTEARIAAKLPAVRAGKTTLLVTASPLLLGAVDEVLFMIDGKISARGSHRELLQLPDYRAVVIRGE